MSDAALSASARELAGVIRRSSAAAVARELDCDESALRNWARGRRCPTPTWRARLHSFDARLDPAGWSADASTQTAPVRGRAPRSQARASRLASTAGGEERLIEVIRQCDELFAEASDPEAHASVRDRTAILAAKASATVRLSKVRGEDAVSMRKFLESKDWHHIERAFEVAFEEAPKLMKKFRTQMLALEEAAKRRGR